MTRYFVGLDLGQASDYTAVAILRRDGPFKGTFGEDLDVPYTYRIGTLYRPKLNTPYTTIVEGLKNMLRPKDQNRADRMQYEIVADATGVGRPVVDLMRQEGLHVVPVTITGGTHTTLSKGFYGVPKRELVSALQILFQSGDLKIARGLKLGGTLREELKNFKVKINTATKHESYEHWRDGDHDDLVLATALAAWRATRGIARRPNETQRLLQELVR